MRFVAAAMMFLLAYLPQVGAAPPPAKGLMDGRPIVLMWQVNADSTDAELDELKSLGVTCIQHFALTDWDDSRIQAYLDRAARHGLMVIVYLGFLLDHEPAGAIGGRLTSMGVTVGADSPHPPWSLGTRARQFIAKWKSHPAIAAWHSFDEPAEASKFADAKDLESIYTAIHEADPSRPVMLSMNLTRDGQYATSFSERAFDLLDLHAYVNDSVGDRQKALIDTFVQHRHRDYPVIITLRAFNGAGWTDMGKDNSLQSQYDFFFGRNHLTQNMGFYGWRLSPNRGIEDVPEIRHQYLDLSRRIARNPAP